MNKIKNQIGKFIRKIIVKYYRLLGVRIGNNVFISHNCHIDTTYHGSVIIEDNVYITSGAKIIAHDHSVYRHMPFTIDDGCGKVLLKKMCLLVVVQSCSEM